jgi:hypothetical protein
MLEAIILFVIPFNEVRARRPKSFQAAATLTVTLYPSQASDSVQCRVHSTAAEPAAGVMSALNPALHGLPGVVAPDNLEARAIQNAQRVSRCDALDGPLPRVDFQPGADPAAAFRCAIPLVDRVDAVKDLAVESRAQQLEILRMRPHQRHRRAGRAPHAQAPLRPIGLVPNLLRQKLAAGRKLLVSFDQRSDVASRCQLVMRAFAG